MCFNFRFPHQNESSPCTFCYAANPESAFVHAIESAGITLAIARTCSRGDAVTHCGCDKDWTSERPKDFTWGSCSDNFVKGEQFARQFLDGRKNSSSSLSVVESHNYETGRQVSNWKCIPEHFILVLIMSVTTMLNQTCLVAIKCKISNFLHTRAIELHLPGSISDTFSVMIEGAIVEARSIPWFSDSSEHSLPRDSN